MATNPNEGEQKFAIRKLVRLRSGKVGVVFIDAITGSVIPASQINDYTLITAGNLEDLEENTEEVPEELSDEVEQSISEFQAITEGSGEDYGFEGARDLGLGSGLEGWASTAAAEEALGQMANSTPGGFANNLTSVYDPYTSPTNPAPVTDVETNPDFNDPRGYGSTPGREPTWSPGAQRTLPPDPRTLATVDKAVKDTLGPDYSIAVYSGSQHTKDEVTKGTGSRTGSDRHDHDRPGAAIDFAVVGPDGPVTDMATLDAIAENAALGGISGIGYGGSYMGGTNMHMDMRAPGPGQDNAWGKRGNEKQSGLETFMSVGDAMRGPDGTYSDLAPTDRETAYASVYGNEDDSRSIAQSMIDSVTEDTASIPDTLDVTSLSPAGLSNIGYGPERSPADIAAMARTIAGELSGDQLRGLAENDPVARAELASMITSMENRSQTSMHDDKMQGVISPENYNSNMSSNADVTDENYGLFGPAIEQGIKDFYSGAIQPSADLASTHYYNPDEARPSWGRTMDNARMVGDHLYGKAYDPRYDDTSTGFMSRQEQAINEVGTSRINDQSSGGFATPDYGFSSQGPSFSDPSPESGGASGLGGARGGSFGDGSRGGSSYGGSSFGGDAGLGGARSGPAGDGSRGSSGTDYSSSNSGGLGPGSAASRSITSSAPSISTSGSGSSNYSESETSANRDATFSDWSGWI